MGQKSGKHKKDSNHLSDEDIDRLTKNTTYSRQQIQDWHQGFLRYSQWRRRDTRFRGWSNIVVFLSTRDCPNGKLDKKKFLEVYKVRLNEAQALLVHCSWHNHCLLVVCRNFTRKAKPKSSVYKYSKPSVSIDRCISFSHSISARFFRLGWQWLHRLRGVPHCGEYHLSWSVSSSQFQSRFLSAMCALGDVREKLRLAFDMYDMNKNGKVIAFEWSLEKESRDLKKQRCLMRYTNAGTYAGAVRIPFHQSIVLGRCRMRKTSCCMEIYVCR